MKKRIAEAKTTQVTLSVNQTETCDQTGKTINSVNQTFTADSIDEIDRILHLAGLGRSGAAVAAEPTVRMLIQGGHPAGCQCQECCHPQGCRCEACCGLTEGRDLPPGFHDYEAHGPEDAVDLNFNTAEDELTEQGVGHMDYGHRDYDDTDSYDLSAFSHDHGRAGNPVRYTPANSGDNPMKSDMVEDDESVEASYSEAINDAVRQIGEDPNAIDDCVEQIASDFGKSHDEVHQEILDQRDVLGDDSMVDDDINQPLMMATEGRVRVEESLQMLTENHSPAFVSALHKVRDGLFESLNAAEISNLATAFINLMQSPDSQRVTRTHRAFRQYISEAAMLREYRKFAGK